MKAPLILGWTGMRGVVSLAAALSISAKFDNGMDFPHRNLILYITFIVILITLVLQGLTLPVIIKKIKLPVFNDHLPEEETENLIREALAKDSLDFLKEHHSPEMESSLILQQLARQWEMHLTPGENTAMPDNIKLIYRNILERQRQLLLQKNNSIQRIDEEIIRKFLHRIDLEEEKMAME
jgi:CPA1 family monovalent cation:H+ antiporter